MSDNPDRSSRQHERLIDHFKRVYAVVAGLALSEACRHTLPAQSLGEYQLWMFAALFITLVPIFHGGDRSLDHKYLNAPPKTSFQVLAFLWDDYMLLLTALLFVCAAESIPQAGQPCAAVKLDPSRFFFWMATMFGFDVAVLLADDARTCVLKKLGHKSWREALEIKPHHLAWSGMNFCMCLFCGWAWLITSRPAAGQQVFVVEGIGQVSLIDICLAILFLCCLRTLADYLVGRVALFSSNFNDATQAQR